MTYTTKNKGLHKAKHDTNNDDFYTQIKDIEAEINRYTAHFEGKIVYCNSDDFNKSNFAEYFRRRFFDLKLKRLVCTAFNFRVNSSPLAPATNEKAHRWDYDGYNATITELKGNGDFMSAECMNILNSCDILVTNPPFSKTREFIPALIKTGKRFIILSNITTIVYKELIPLFMNGRFWPGTKTDGEMEFFVPANYPMTSARCRIDESGNKRKSIGTALWLTNLIPDTEKKFIELAKKYNSKDYPFYDGNCDIIESSSVADIPMDYKGAIGVPISFLYKWNPKQFEILNVKRNLFIDGKEKFMRIIIKNKWLNRGCNDAKNSV